MKSSVIVVTGANRGIGKSISQFLHKKGVIVIGLDKEWSGSDIQYEKVEVDLSNKNILKIACDTIKKRFKKIDGLVNCAGVTLPSESETYPLDFWQKTIDINLTVPFLLIENLKNELIASKGSIVNVSSLNGKLAFPNNPSYVASKTGLDGLTRSYALALGKHSVRVNSIAPGYIKTEMTGESWENLEKRKKRSERSMLGRWGRPEDICGPVEFLLSESSSFITGQTLYVDGGWSAKGF